MEDTLGARIDVKKNPKTGVLILVLMEDTLGGWLHTLKQQRV